MSEEYDSMLEEIVAQHHEYLERWIFDYQDHYSEYLNSGRTMVPYGSTMVSLPEEVEIRSDRYDEVLMLAAQHAWEDGRITKHGDTFIIN